MDEILQQEQPTGDPPEHLENDLNFLRVEEIENGTYIAAEPNFFPKKEVQAVRISLINKFLSF